MAGFINHYNCPECSKSYYDDPDGPTAGSICNTCAEKMLDEIKDEDCPPLSEEQINRIMSKVWKLINDLPNHTPESNSRGLGRD